MEYFDKILMNVVSIAIICFAIFQTYKLLYGKPAWTYLLNQEGIIVAGCIVNFIVMNVYYLYIVPIIPSQYQSVVLIFAFFVSGILIDKSFQRIFKSKKSKFESTNEEYLVLMLISFIAISILMTSDGIMPLVDIFTIVLGRLIWVDTKSFNDIRKEIFVTHKRIIETGCLLIIGILVISITTYCFKCPELKVFIAVIYGMLICTIYHKIRKKIHKVL